jgi:hypothetical protein
MSSRTPLVGGTRCSHALRGDEPRDEQQGQMTDHSWRIARARDRVALRVTKHRSRPFLPSIPAFQASNLP